MSSTPVVVQRLPFVPNPELHFDKYAHDPSTRPSRMVTPDSHLTHSDRHMVHVLRHSTSRHGGHKWVPEWAKSDEQLRRVLLVKTWQYAAPGRGKPIPPDLTLQQVKAAADRRFAREVVRERSKPGTVQWMMHERHKFAVSKAGGPLEFLTRLVYLSYRQGFTSVDVAQEMYTAPYAVRQILLRCNRTAEKIGFVVHTVPHHCKGVSRPVITERAAKRRARKERQREYWREQSRKRRATPVGHAGDITAFKSWYYRNREVVLAARSAGVTVTEIRRRTGVRVAPVTAPENTKASVTGGQVVQVELCQV